MKYACTLHKPRKNVLARAPVAATLAFCAALALSACGRDKPAESGSIAAPPAEIATIQPASAVPGPTETAMDAFRQINPPEGLKLAPLFNPSQKPDERITRLETVVQGMHDNFETVLPSIVRMAGFEKDMRELVGVLETMTQRAAQKNAIPVPTPAEIAGTAPVPEGAAPQEAAAPPPPPPEPPIFPEDEKKATIPDDAFKAQAPFDGNSPGSAPLPLAKTPPAVAAAQENGVPRAAVHAIRVGNGASKARIVLDLSANTDSEAAVENGGKTLVITLPGATWPAQKSWKDLKPALVGGYRVEGQDLRIDLTRPGTITRQSLLPPNPDSPNYRLVIDIAPG